jgi:hypothetical protein
VVARNDQKQAQISVDSAIQQKRTAEASADLNRINQAQIALRNAEDLKNAAAARVQYLEAYGVFVKRHWRYTQENMYWKEAKYEHAKAEIAKSNSIQPRDVQYEWFPKQVDDRGKRTGVARDKEASLRANAMRARDTWVKLQSAADHENNRTTTAWDPMAPEGSSAGSTANANAHVEVPVNGGAQGGPKSGMTTTGTAGGPVTNTATTNPPPQQPPPTPPPPPNQGGTNGGEQKPQQ